MTGPTIAERRRNWAKLSRSKSSASNLSNPWKTRVPKEVDFSHATETASVQRIKEQLEKFDLSSTAPITTVPTSVPKTDLPTSVLRTLPERKRIALVAHDKRKGKLLEWTQKWREVLRGHDLLGTGTTSMWLREQVGLEVEGLLSGPFGGDQQIGARIAEQRLDMLVFFWDPFDVMPHDSDVKALLRIATLYNVPIANNPITADFLISSPLMSQSVQCQLPDTKQWLASRKPAN
ncbi:methylglyoxal synthase-like [Oratosquilla oratoria]|uniref:methylglyoxal synthase-like n=1 Tax=Oratosquilla oratoria TaxID=337810 RepID=UPI003F7626B5